MPGAGAQLTSKSGEAALCVTSRPSPAGSTSYSHPLTRPATETSTGPSAAVASSDPSQHSLVVFEPAATTSQRSSRELPIPSQNRSSSSCSSSVSVAGSAPISWRHTWYGRQASSTRV
jgi:hypothetical protein